MDHGMGRTSLCFLRRTTGEARVGFSTSLATATASNKFPVPSSAFFFRTRSWEALSSFSVMLGLSLFATQLKGLLKETLNVRRSQ